MLKIKFNDWQIKYCIEILQYIARYDAAEMDALYILFANDWLPTIEKLSKRPNKKTYTVKFNGHDTLIFNEIIDIYYNSIKHNKQLAIERQYLIGLFNLTKIS